MQESGGKVHDFVFSGEMVDFVTLANEWCAYLEDLDGVKGTSFIAEMVRLLSGIYTGFLKLEGTEPLLDGSVEPTVTEQDWSGLYQKVSRILGPFNEYLKQVKAEEFDRSELVPHTISEDIADIYQELRDFTTVYSTGLEEIMNDAAWELKERFTEHWGRKVLQSMTALHELYVSGADPEESE